MTLDDTPTAVVDRRRRPARRRGRRPGRAGRPASTGARRCRAPRPTWRPWPPTRGARTPTRRRWRAMLDVQRDRWSTSHPASRGCSASSRGEFLHAGPPIAWDRASGPLRGALMGGAALEGLVDDPEDAVALFEAGTSVSLEPCHHRARRRPDGRRGHAVDVDVRARGPGHRARVPTARSTRASARCCATAPTRPRCSTRLRWMGDVLGPLLQRRRPRRPGRSTSPAILTQMLQMGDEAHNRNRAGTLMLLRDLSPGAWSTSGCDAGRRRRGAALRRRQRPLLPQPRDAGLQARARRRPRHRRLDDGRRDGPQRHRLRHPGRRHRRRVVHRPGAGGRRAVPRRLRPRRRQPRHRRLGDHRDRRHRRLRDGDRAGDRAASSAARCPTRSPPPAGCTRSRSARTRAGRSRCWSSRARRPASTSPRSAAPASCRRSTPAWPARVAGVGQVGAGLVTPPAEIFPQALSRLAGAGARAGGRQNACLRSTLPLGRSGVPSSR